MSQPVLSNATKAYSYIRFSTPQQALGDSLRRQTEKAAKYAGEHGLTLDTELNLSDLGKSGYRSGNAKRGALRVFLDALEAGHIAVGSYLLVENMDRLSRDEIVEAMGTFLLIITGGITLVTLTDGRAYSRETLRQDPYAMQYIVAEMTRANAESRRKSETVGAAKARRKQRLIIEGVNGKPYLYVKLPETSVNTTNTTLGGAANHALGTAFHTARAGLNFRY